MSRLEKLIERFKSKPKDFSYDELKRLMSGLGYGQDERGKSSGSRVAFIQNESLHIIRLHKPHPKNILKAYQIDQILEELDKQGSI